MPVQTSYPGVYVQEVPSGVRTIVGVSTAVAVFIGRTKKGPLKTPVLCLSFSDFERTFSSDYAGSELSRAVRLFFLNGGSQCYVMRIADGAAQSDADLNNSGGTPVLRLTAKSAGLIGDTIRAEVSYNTPFPESTFNLTVFRWVTNSGGQTVKADQEVLQNLSMNPSDPRYVQTYVSQNSALVDAAIIGGAPTAGYSQSGRPIRAADADYRTAMIGILATGKAFRINVNNTGFVNVNLSGVDLGAGVTAANIIGDIEQIINDTLPLGASVTVSNVDGPGTGLNNTFLIRITGAGNTDVRIEPAANNDVARTLMLGTAQGGLEVSAYAAARPAPNGLVFDLADLVTFSEKEQTAFNTITVSGTAISLGTSLRTVLVAGSLMHQDNFPASVTGHHDGVREKWAIIANAVNEQQITNPAFRWTAQVWGSRLALIAGDGSDSSIGTVASSGADGFDISPLFQTPNVRYYNLSGGADGNAPTLLQYSEAFLKLDKEVDLFNLMILPRDADHSVSMVESLWGPASVFCQQRRAFLIMDAPEQWGTVQQATDPANGVNKLRIGLVKDHSAIFHPRLTIRENGLNVQTGPSGAIAGLMARTDGSRGVWKAPAGTEADIRGITGLEQRFNDNENGVLNKRAINTIRIFPNGIVNWGARTMDGDDDFGSEWKYIPVRRTALFIEESLYRGLKWVVFEPNDEPLWGQIRLNAGAFMHGLFRQGAFQGQKRDDAYFVKCDRETTTQNDINLGIVNIWVGFAPLKPAEFVVLYLQQMAGQIQV
ncbi:phage tail sheath subtilisin-like domain-containing protein [Chitinophaga sp. CF418]|uniref:phage tail sheath subtilisin-like domain-containing protein n=1 Tax=Chitinophaga sp. CF418 TaxID=1855287 RepID=UPI00091BCB4E|nr:phage tail sheath subtilisin-like domain-containing protein [Chitinophaga sp. CF418]SHN40860.1 hypothetical protein SAMN05216311_112124 [Chitinophaga sp. CF418]